LPFKEIPTVAPSGGEWFTQFYLAGKSNSTKTSIIKNIQVINSTHCHCISHWQPVVQGCQWSKDTNGPSMPMVEGRQWSKDANGTRKPMITERVDSAPGS